LPGAGGLVTVVRVRLPVRGRKAVAIMSALGLMVVSGACAGSESKAAGRGASSSSAGRATASATGPATTPDWSGR
jgi:hypothetical protein